VFTAGSQDVNNRFVASQLLYGSPLALPFPDVLRTDLLVGANPIVSHGSVLTVPRIKDRMHDIVKRGSCVLVIDPRKTETAAKFEWLGIIPDGDAFLLLALLHVLFGENLVERARLARQADSALARATGAAVQSRSHPAQHRHRPGHRTGVGAGSRAHATGGGVRPCRN
jgi:anaerobic selenocysteine-containing dehydrogenase